MEQESKDLKATLKRRDEQVAYLTYKLNQANETFNSIIQLTEANDYGQSDTRRNKIKELCQDAQRNLKKELLM